MKTLKEISWSLIRAETHEISYKNLIRKLCSKKHDELSHGNLIRKLWSKKREISSGNLITAHKKHENPVRKSHTKNVHHKWSRIRVRPEKEADFVHRQPKKRRRKNPDQKIPWPAKKANSNFMHNQLLSSLLNIFSITSPPSHLFATNPKPPTIWKQSCLGQGPKGMKSQKEISQRPKSMKYNKDIS
jgi:hypothetical protein